MCAVEIGLVICRKPHHIERLCTEDERQQSQSSDGHKRPALYFLLRLFIAVTKKGVAFPPLLQGSSVDSVQYCATVNILIHLPKTRLCNARVKQYENCSELEKGR